MEDFCKDMLHNNMNISLQTVHAQQVEESRLRRKNREVKRDKSFESGASKERLEIQDKPKFKKRFSNQVTSQYSKDCDDTVSNPMSQKGRGTILPTKKPTCSKCGEMHWDEC